jgi:SMC proteins Flexible Hinge Domain.
LRVEEANRASALRALDALQQRRGRLEGEHGAIVGPDEREVAEREARLEAMQDALDTHQHELSARQARLPDAQAALKAALEHERAMQRRLTELRARREALLQLQARVQSQGKLGDWLKRHGLDHLPPLWKHLQVEAGWDDAVQAVLRERLSALTSPDALAAEAAARTLLDERPPESLALAFVEASARDAETDAATAAMALAETAAGALAATDVTSTRPKPLSALVRVTDPALRGLVDEFLTGAFAVERLEDWLPSRARLPSGLCLVGPHGQVLSRGARTPRPRRPHSWRDRAPARDRHLAGEQGALEEAAALAHDALLAAEAHASDVQEQINTLRRELQSAQSQVHAEQVEVLKLAQARSRADERRNQLTRDLEDLVRLDATEREHLARAEMEQARAVELAELQRERLDGAMAVLSEREQALREARALEQAAARELQEARFSERECAGKLEDIARNQQLAAEQLARIVSETDTRQAELDATDDNRSHAALQSALALRTTREAALAARRDAMEARPRP